MAVLMLLGVIRRQAVAVVVGVALTGFALFLVGKVPGVYYSQVNVWLYAPQGPWYVNTYQNVTPTLISTAGLLQRTVTIGHGAQPVSEAVTLVGVGIKHGYSVRVPNAGGQWAFNFERPVLNVEATGSSIGEVEATMNSTLGKIDKTLQQMQDAYGAPRDQQIHTRLSPPEPQIVLAAGSPVRAKAVTVLLGLFLTVTGAGLLDLIRVARRRRAGAGQAIPGRSVALPQHQDAELEAAGV